MLVKGGKITMSNWFIDGGGFWLLENYTMFLFENA